MIEMWIDIAHELVDLPFVGAYVWMGRYLGVWLVGREPEPENRNICSPDEPRHAAVLQRTLMVTRGSTNSDQWSGWGHTEGEPPLRD